MKLVLKEVKSFLGKQKTLALYVVNIESSMLREVWEWCDNNDIYFLTSTRGLTITDDCITVEGEWGEVEKELNSILLLKEIL